LCPRIFKDKIEAPSSEPDLGIDNFYRESGL
jgi:hypothetical protein